MGAKRVTNSEVLWEGPLFSDEIGWKKGLTQSLREQFDLQSRRVIPAKEAMRDVFTIYFRPVHREWALVRYVQRYRWIFEVLLRQGMAGERRLIDNDFTPTDLEFLRDIVPVPDERPNPAVYDILWRAVPFPAHIRIIKALKDKPAFTPADILQQTDGVDDSDLFVFKRLIRTHLIERTGTGVHPNDRRTGSNNSISVAVDEQYRCTSEGTHAIPAIVSEYERIIEREEFEPLRINPTADPQSHIPGEDSTATTDGEELDPVESETTADDSGDILAEIESEFAAFTDPDSTETSASTPSETESGDPAVDSSRGSEPDESSEDLHPPIDEATDSQADTTEEVYSERGSDESAADEHSGEQDTPTSDSMDTSLTPDSEMWSQESAQARISQLESTVAELEARITALEQRESTAQPASGKRESDQSSTEAEESAMAPNEPQGPAVHTDKNGEGTDTATARSLSSKPENATEKPGTTPAVELIESFLRQYRSASRSKLRLHIWEHLDHDAGSPRDVWNTFDVDTLVENHPNIESRRGNQFTISEPDPAEYFDIDPEEERTRSTVLRAVYFWIQEQDSVTKAEIETYLDELDHQSLDSAANLTDFLWETFIESDRFVRENGELEYSGGD